MLHVTTRARWREWLARHHDQESEIWLVYNKKRSGRPRVAYDEAVEEALCFGWIDGIAKPIDEDRYAVHAAEGEKQLVGLEPPEGRETREGAANDSRGTGAAAEETGRAQPASGGGRRS